MVAPSHQCAGIGQDQETLLSHERAQRLAAEILTADELHRMDPDLAALAVTLTFSLKESLFKALYPIVQQRFYFEHAEVLEWSTDGHARLRLLKDLSTDWRQGHELEGQFSIQNDQVLTLISV